MPSDRTEESISDRPWLVEIDVDGFGPGHRLWSKFIEALIHRDDAGLSWLVPDPGAAGQEGGCLRASVDASTPEAAVRRALAVAGDVGRSVDRFDKVFWAGIRGAATRQ